MFSQVIFILSAVILTSGSPLSASSYTAVSRPHSDSYKYGIDHSYHGHWYGESHPHGAGGLGGHGGYLLGGGHAVGLIPQKGYGAGYGYGHGYATSYQNHKQYHESHPVYVKHEVYPELYNHDDEYIIYTNNYGDHGIYDGYYDDY